MRNSFYKILLSLLVALLTIPSTVNACSPAPGDDWFSTNIVLNTDTLPESIKFHKPDNDNNYYTFSNSSSEPFYLLQLKRYYHNDTYAPLEIELPEELIPSYKITNTQSYYWGINTSSEDPYDWGLNENSTRATLFESTYELDGESKQIQEDGRPLVVNIPKPQNLIIYAYYDGELIEINGQYTYSYNFSYDSTQHAKGIEACDILNNSMIAPQPVIYKYALGLLLWVIGIKAIGVIITKRIKTTDN